MNLRRLMASLALACVAFVVLASPSAGASAPSRKKAIWGPVTYEGKSQFPIYHDLGVGIFQIALDWSSVAPSRPANGADPDDPAYKWPTDMDLAVREAQRYGIRISVMLIRTPAWSSGTAAVNAHPGSAADYADFAEAAAKRYPTVHLWMVWGEPIRDPNWMLHLSQSPNYYVDPSRQEPAPPFTSGQRADDRAYAELVDATYVRLKRLDRRNLIIGGNTTTSGNVDPHNWIKNLKLANGKPPRMDMYGHNPFGTRIPDLSQPQLVPDTADFSDLDTLAGWIDRYLAKGDRNRHLPIFISEYTVPTDAAGNEFAFHVTRPLQAKWLRAGLRIARSWKRIYTLGWIGLRDSGVPTPQGGSRTGLIDFKGVRKPAYYVFKAG